MLPRHLLAMPVALLVSGLAVAPASADPYVGTITTSCTVDLDASAADRRLSAVVDVNGSGTAPVRGVLVAVFSGPDGVMRRERVDYDGVEQTIDVSFRPMGLATFAREATVAGELQ